ncbi:MAG: ISAs1 family transposase [Myxococcales bacterium]|nr:ISAs1 family transposase [Myxococcales bacterium]
MASLDLLSCLSVVPDPRIDRNKRHDLGEMLFVAVCAVLSGAQGWSDIVEFAHAKEAWLRKFVRLENGVPVDDTFARVLSRVKPQALNEAFLVWVRALVSDASGRFVAIDGKTVRRSYDRRRERGPLHLVSAWATQHGFALGQVRTQEKSNEITAIPQLLHQLELAGAVVTLDAMGCQREVAAQIRAEKGDYVLAVKANQGALHEALEDFFATAEAADYAGVEHTYYEETDAGHGRVERRRCWASERLSTLPEPERWAGLRSIALVCSERHCGETVSTERRLFISSLPAKADAISRAVRAHWHIENGLHWVLDVTFREDESRIRRGYGAENFSVLRHLALNLLKREPTAISMRKKRIRAGFSDEFREQVIQAVAL